jgi:hypothetical protein
MIARAALLVPALAVCLSLLAPVVPLPAQATQTLHLSLGRWTSAQALNGSVPNVRKYLLRVTGKPGEFVQLAASGLPKGWIVSFCTPSICAPFHESVQLSKSGEFDTELQIIPADSDLRVRTHFTVAARAAGSRVELAVR